jgi:hypothetical protein
MTALRTLLQRPEAIQKILLWLVLAGLFILLVEIRIEHRAVLGEKWQPWIPFIYLLVMAVVGPMSMIFFRSFGRKVLAVCFVGLAVVGSLGFWFHSEGKPVEKVINIVVTDFKEPGHLEVSDDEHVAPVLAPLSLVGLAAIGVVLCLWRTDNGVKQE